jgi:AhpD family alkylhydroperoxidase
MAYAKAAPGVYKTMLALESYLNDCGLERGLLDLVRLRASQINGCAFCIDMHWKDLRAAGESEQRLYELNAWRETPFFSDRERAALELTESMTLLAETHVPDAVFEAAERAFEPHELAVLIWQITVINAWNRIGVSTRMQPAA